MNTLEVRDRVQRLLSTLLGTVEVDRDGDFTFVYESARVYVAVQPFRENTLVRIFSVTNWRVPGSPELFKFVATTGYTYGALILWDNEDGTYNVNFSHALLGDFLDPDELKLALLAITFTANEIDDEIKGRFGGLLSSEL